MYISPISAIHLPYIFPISPLYLPYISQSNICVIDITSTRMLGSYPQAG